MSLKETLWDERKRKCAVCGKQFWAKNIWAYQSGYKDKHLYYCSWHCLRADEKKHMTISDLINQAIRSGLSDDEIIDKLGVTQRQIDFRQVKQS